jgi:hypothetical protein
MIDVRRTTLRDDAVFLMLAGVFVALNAFLIVRGGENRLASRL